MDLTALAQQATNILLPVLPFIYAGKDVVTDKVKDMLLEKGIEKLGAKSVDKAKVMFDKIRSKESESIEKSFKELSQNPEDLKAKSELQQEILKLLIANPGLAENIEFTINFDMENINQYVVGDHNTSINFDNSSKQKFENCKFEGNVFGNNSLYTDNSQDILRQLQKEQQIKDIENRLEKFYIPAEDIINGKLKKNHEQTISGWPPANYIGLIDLRKYSYLADKETYEAYETYIKSNCIETKEITCQDKYTNKPKGFNVCEDYKSCCYYQYDKCPHNLNYCKYYNECPPKDQSGIIQDNTKCKYYIDLKMKIEKDIENYKNELLKLKNNRR